MKLLVDKTIPLIFQKNVEKYKDKPIVGYKDSKSGKYKDISWSQVSEMVSNIACYLLSMDVKKGDKIAIYSANRFEWWVADLAILSIGAINVPIYATNSTEETSYVLDHSGAIICFAGSNDQLENVLTAKKKLPKLKKVVLFDKLKAKKKDVLAFENALTLGQKSKKLTTFQKKLKTIKPTDVATIMYTSGTTGNPKGVILTHDNFISNVRQLVNEFEQYVTVDDIFLSFLPLSHSLERTVGFYLPLCTGAKVVFAENFQKVSQNIQEVRPTIMISVPRLYEKIHSVILSKVGDASIVKRVMFNLAVKTAAKNLKYICNNKPRTGLFAKRYNFFDKIIYKKLRAALGMDRIKIAVTGGGPLSVSDVEFFLGMGIRILEGFGLTETTPVTHVNKFGKIKTGSVGPSLPQTKVKISDEGEILIKGPQVMQGYYKDKKATTEAFTKNGFFRTGDLGVMDDDNFLFITGRKKDIIVTAGGKNISPQNIENKLKESAYIEQIAIIGDHRKFLSALIVPEFDELKKWAKKHEVEYTTKKDLLKKDQIKDLIEKEIEKYSANFSRVEQVKKFTLMAKEWSQATEELTPSLKVKRKVINSKYAKEIENMYKDA